MCVVVYVSFGVGEVMVVCMANTNGPHLWEACDL